MVQLRLRFPGGRYHATPWDHHVNEAVAEWPPSPLRILRALLAALHERCPELNQDTALSAIASLREPPSYSLPAGVSSHTRHYLSKNEVDRGATALAFDAFVSLDREDEVWVHWPVALSLGERRALAALAAQVSYLGRAESWCEMRLVDEGAHSPRINCAPLLGRGGPGGEAERTTRVLCPAADLRIEHLQMTTGQIRAEGYADPPGARWVAYHLPPEPALAGHWGQRRAGLIRPQVAEFALGGTVLPLFTDGVRVAELFRRAALSLHRTRSRTLSGKDEDGRPLADGHQHAHYLPDCRDPAGLRVTHVYVYAPCGFTESEQRALTRIRFLHWQVLAEAEAILSRNADIAREVGTSPVGRRETGSIDVVFCGFGDAAQYTEVSRVFGRARVWRSQTPFVLPRHAHKERDGAEEQVRRELRHRDHLGAYAESVVVKSMPHAQPSPERMVPWIEFRRWRQRDAGWRRFDGFELVFPQQVQGPILLGYGSHYGLGQFVALPRP
jgi:CRISPR-associated protein Csb2